MTAWTLSVHEKPASSAAQVDVTVDGLPTVGKSECRRKWDEVVDQFIVPWASGQIDIDGDLIPPTASSVRVAAALAHRFRDAGEQPPTGVLPDGDGGIVFERRLGLASTQINVLHDGDVALVEYDVKGLVRRDMVPAGSFDV